MATLSNLTPTDIARFQDVKEVDLDGPPLTDNDLATSFQNLRVISKKGFRVFITPFKTSFTACWTGMMKLVRTVTLMNVLLEENCVDTQYHFSIKQQLWLAAAPQFTNISAAKGKTIIAEGKIPISMQNGKWKIDIPAEMIDKTKAGMKQDQSWIAMYQAGTVTIEGTLVSLVPYLIGKTTDPAKMRAMQQMWNGSSAVAAALVGCLLEDSPMNKAFSIWLWCGGVFAGPVYAAIYFSTFVRQVGALAFANSEDDDTIARAINNFDRNAQNTSANPLLRAIGRAWVLGYAWKRRLEVDPNDKNDNGDDEVDAHGNTTTTVRDSMYGMPVPIVVRSFISEDRKMGELSAYQWGCCCAVAVFMGDETFINKVGLDETIPGEDVILDFLALDSWVIHKKLNDVPEAFKTGGATLPSVMADEKHKPQKKKKKKKPSP